MNGISPNPDWADRAHPDVLVLFDVDGTLSPARRPATPEMLALLKEVRKKAVIGFVGGSDLIKQHEQLGSTILEDFDFCFAENGLTAYRKGVQLPSESFINWMGEEKYKTLVNFCLHYIADLDLPKKRGTFIEFRNGMINVSPIGRNASVEERHEYERYDLEHKIRATFVDTLKKKFPDYNLTYSVGGQISFDVFPTGWDKTFCLRHVEKEGFKTIHFFGDKTFPGGNDYEICNDPRVTGHPIKNPDETAAGLRQIFGL